ncbi:hypothetical protein CDD81_5800 [Ophiocordyceps australis]|uniref:Amidohydrolase 3 domain-containing protein n=1 Tax=Ophiocordyceps australis TaxID=1399860 RepID=A0A2C5X9U3_9HYPO|nr:hypothetical protein CDD81_5800 [Ophiocordyceps australis]
MKGKSQPPPAIRRRIRNHLRLRRSLSLLSLSLLAIIAFSQWHQAWHTPSHHAPHLSRQQLERDLATCQQLRVKPSDPPGPGRRQSERYGDWKPTLIRNATVWTGEPRRGTSEHEARRGEGWEWVRANVWLERGLITRVDVRHGNDEEREVTIPDNMLVYDAHGRQLTAGIIDMHSHAGVASLPQVQGNDDTNEMSENITPWARSIDGLMPLDPQLQIIKSGGVTTSLILPGSGNNIGGEAYVVKHAIGHPDGRPELSAADMLADKTRSWRYIKMACGENAKRAYGSKGKRPVSRMGESFDFRRAFEQARGLVRRQNDWCARAERGLAGVEEYLPQELAWETLAAVLRGQVLVNTHCYTVPDFEAMVDHSNEFEFAIRAFHHAHQTFLVPELLNRTWGGRPPSSALFADSMYYKMESYIGTPHAGKILYDAGLTPIYVSDNPVLNAQHVVFEAAKAYRYGLPYHAALASVTSAPANELGLGQRLGKVKPGFDADVVVWDSDPLSVGATPMQVWIDGRAQFEEPFVLDKPNRGPIKPDESLQQIDDDDDDEPVEAKHAVFTGVEKVLLEQDYGSQDGHSIFDKTLTKTFNAVVTDGKLSCIGACTAQVQAATAAGAPTSHLRNGYITHSLTGAAGLLGLNDIDAEPSTENGNNAEKFTRAVDALQLGGKKLRAGARYGVTRAISAPKLNDGSTHHGTSVGFVTTAKTSLDEGAVFAQDVAVHYTLDLAVRPEKSYSDVFGELRHKLLAAVAAIAKENKAGDAPDAYSEAAQLKKVVGGEMVLALTIHSADGIATALRIKHEIDTAMHTTHQSNTTMRMAIIGGSEAHLVASHLAAANTGVILTPPRPYTSRWDMRRALPGAPLTNGTVADWLADAGVPIALGLAEDYMVRHLGLDAGTAWRNGGGRWDEKRALDLVSVNVEAILGVQASRAGHFVVSEQSPLETWSRVVAVGAGGGSVALYGSG